MHKKTLDLRKVFGMIVTYDSSQMLNSPNKAFDVDTELYPGGESAIHIHPNQEEIYEVKEGEIELFLGEKWETLRAGERVVIPKGAVHGFRNKSKAKVVAFNSHNPGLTFGEMLETIQAYINEGKITSTKGFRNLVYMSSIMVMYKEVMTTVNPPYFLIKLLSRIGKALGYK